MKFTEYKNKSLTKLWAQVHETTGLTERDMRSFAWLSDDRLYDPLIDICAENWKCKRPIKICVNALLLEILSGFYNPSGLLINC